METQKHIPLFGVVETPEMEKTAIEVIRSGRIAGGEYVAKFEYEFGQLIGQSNVVSTVDMTSALFLALYLANVKSDDEVLTAAYACMSTNSAIAQIGAIPVWVDVAEKSVEIDLHDLERKITSKTKALILYHVAGYPGPVKEVAELCKRFGIVLIEDCNNALLATRDGQIVGQHGEFSVYSFYPNRQINATEGGALICKNSEAAARARKLRRFGIDLAKFRDSKGEIDSSVDIPEIGWSFTMNNLCAGLAFSQLADVHGRIDRTRDVAQKLMSKIESIKGIQIISFGKHSLPVFWCLLLLVDNRDKVLNFLKTNGIHASIMHHRNDFYSCFKCTEKVDLVNTGYLQKHVLAVPCGWWLNDTDIDVIAHKLQDATK